MTRILVGRSVTDLQTDELDKKLILTIQYVCNADGIKIPWDKVGAIMGEGISDGAVIQHLAKLRQRMVSQNLSTPPPLRRGGGYAIQTSSGGNLGSSSSRLTKNVKKATGASSSVASKKNGEDFDTDEASVSGAELKKNRSRQVRQDSKGKRRNSKAKKDGDDEEESFSGRIEGKRKHQRGETGCTPSKGQAKEDAKTSKPAVRPRKSAIKYGEISESDSDEDSEVRNSEDDEHNVIKEEFVAARATFLRSESSYEESSEERNESLRSLNPKKAMRNSSSKIVVLQIGNSERARNLLENVDYMSGNETDSDSEDEEEQEEMEDDTSQEVINANVATTSSSQMVNVQAGYGTVGFDQPSRAGLRPIGNNFNNAMAVTQIPEATEHDVVHHSAYYPLKLLNSAPSIGQGVNLYAESSSVAGAHGISQHFPDQSFNDHSFMGSGIAPSSNIQGGVYEFASHDVACRDFDGKADGQNFSDHSQISSGYGVHRYSAAGFDAAPSNSLCVPAPNGSGYNMQNNLNRIEDEYGNQYITGLGRQHANGENSSSLHCDVTCTVNANCYSLEMSSQSVSSNHYQNQNVSVGDDLSHEPFFPATQQQMLSPSTYGAAQQASDGSISNEPWSAASTGTVSYDLSPLDHTNLESSQAHSASQGHEETQAEEGLENGDEYSMMDTFDFHSFEANFGNENGFT